MAEKVLIVDDRRDNRNLLKVMLKKEGFELLEAADGNEALQVAFLEKPDVILLDIEMPGPDGYVVCQWLKADERTRGITVVFISGKSRAKDKIKGLELGAADYITKPFDKGEVLARVRNQIQIRRLTSSLIETNRVLSKRTRELEQDLKAAALIQKSLIPRHSPPSKNFKFAWCFHPSDSIGGDIFNIQRLDEDHLCIYIIDVSGHGVPAAMVTVSVSQTLLPDSGVIANLNSVTRQIVDPAQVLHALDQQYPLDRFDKYFTIAYMILELSTGHLQYSRAAHPMPLLVRKDGTVERLEAGGSIIGMGDIVPFEKGSLNMQPGDRLFLYTDGLVEYTDSLNNQYGENRLVEQLLALQNKDLDSVCEHLMSRLWDFGQNRKSLDDITFLAIEYSI